MTAYVQNTIVELSPGNVATPAQTAAFGSANVHGNAIIVFVMTAQGTTTGNPVTGVTDSAGNTYHLVVSESSGGGATNIIAGSIYVAFGVAAHTSNQISVAFTTTNVTAISVYAVEYSGINTFDAGAGANTAAAGTSATSATGNFTTNHVGVIVAANYVDSPTTAPGTNYTSRRITPVDSAIIEDWIGAPAGTNNAKATLTSATTWGMVAANFWNSVVEPTDAVFYGMT